MTFRKLAILVLGASILFGGGAARATSQLPRYDVVVGTAKWGKPAHPLFREHSLPMLTSHMTNVAEIGDSNVVRGAGVATSMFLGGPLDPGDHLNSGYVTSFFARPGVGLDVGWWQAKLANHTFNPDAVIINLGINDAGAVPANYDARITALMLTLPDVPVFFPGYPVSLEPTARQAGAHAINHAWSLAAGRFPNLTIVPWGALAQTHPEWMDTADPAPVREHYTQDGYVALTTMELAAVDSMQPSPTP